MRTSSPASQASREARLRAVYEATYDDLLRFAQRRLHPSHAEDVLADVFLVAWRRLDDMPNGVADARPWLFGVARATILNLRRGDRRREALAVRIADARLTEPVGASDDRAGRLDLAAGAGAPRASRTGEAASAAPTRPPDWRGRDVAREDTYGVGSVNGETFVYAEGRAGADVADIEVTTPGGLEVEASIDNGRWAVWWPAGDDSPDHPEMSGAPTYEVTLRDGTVTDEVRTPE